MLFNRAAARDNRLAPPVLAQSCFLCYDILMSTSKDTPTPESIAVAARFRSVTPAAAIALQNRLRGEVIRTDCLGSVRFIGGADVGIEPDKKIMRAAVAVLSFPQLELYESAVVRAPIRFPYAPGLLSFREAPAILAAIDRLKQLPDLLLCDGQGIAHQRRLGIASHLGVLTGLATVGVAKKRLVGTHPPIPEEKGSRVALVHNQERIGTVLRTRTGVKPLYISIGHKISLDTAVDYVMSCVTRYRLPETTRWAHRLASAKTEDGI